jgi:catechol 2,3-dioxygenase-like lactoylglutathione lyase family enzyme
VNLRAVEIKAFVPAKDFARAKQFYQDLGFHLASDGGGIAYLHVGDAAFLLQEYDFDEAHARQLTIHLLVEDVDAWRRKVDDAGLVAAYGVAVTDVVQQPWRMRDFTLRDPSGVCWRIAQNTD